MRDNPSLREQAVAVGGRPDRRGVIAACNYEARRFGVRSAMATAQALQRCPGLIVLPPAMEKYRAASRQILAIYRDYTGIVEPLSLDEAFLDVTQASHFSGSATLIAREIRARIAQTVGITASAGIAPNKFLAKIASDWNKPNGQFVIKPQQIDAFVAALPVEKLFGVGKVTAAKLQKLGAVNCADLRNRPRADLQHHFGRFGDRLFDLCRGIDMREVCATRERKSISVEETYAIDVPDLAACLQRLPDLIDKLRERVRRAGAEHNLHKLFIKIRFADFRQTTAECVAATPDYTRFQSLLETGFERGRRPVRLLGVGVRLSGHEDITQLALFGGEAAASPEMVSN